MRKRRFVQIRAQQKLGTAAMFQDIDTELTARLHSLMKGSEGQIRRSLRATVMAKTAVFLCCIPRIGPVESTTIVAETPHLSVIIAAEATVLARLAPRVYVSGTLRGKRAIRAMRQVTFQAALVDFHHNPAMKASQTACENPENFTRLSLRRSLKNWPKSPTTCAEGVRNRALWHPDRYSCSGFHDAPFKRICQTESCYFKHMLQFWAFISRRISPSG